MEGGLSLRLVGLHEGHILCMESRPCLHGGLCGAWEHALCLEGWHCMWARGVHGNMHDARVAVKDCQPFILCWDNPYVSQAINLINLVKLA
eukprot:361857-Chlamydomonas_euryale.AAC.4